MTPLERYLRLERLLATCPEGSGEYDAALDSMDGAWAELSSEERDALNQRTEQPRAAKHRSQRESP